MPAVRELEGADAVAPSSVWLTGRAMSSTPNVTGMEEPSLLNDLFGRYSGYAPGSPGVVRKKSAARSAAAARAAAAPNGKPHGGGRKKRCATTDILTAAAACVVLLTGTLALALPSSRAGLLDLLMWCKVRWWSAFLYIPVVMFAAVSAMPIVIFVVAAGYTWELWLAVLVAYIGGLLGCMCSFWIGRRWLQEPLQRMCWQQSDTMRGMEGLLSDPVNGWRWVLLIRLPYMPLAHVSYILAATNIDWKVFTLATAIGIVPGSVVYCYIGSGIKDLQSFISGDSDAGSGIVTVFEICGLVLTIGAFVALVVVSRRRVNEQIRQSMLAERDRTFV